MPFAPSDSSSCADAVAPEDEALVRALRVVEGSAKDRHAAVSEVFLILRRHAGHPLLYLGFPHARRGWPSGAQAMLSMPQECRPILEDLARTPLSGREVLEASLWESDRFNNACSWMVAVAAGVLGGIVLFDLQRTWFLYSPWWLAMWWLAIVVGVAGPFAALALRDWIRSLLLLADIATVPHSFLRPGLGERLRNPFPGLNSWGIGLIIAQVAAILGPLGWLVLRMDAGFSRSPLDGGDHFPLRPLQLLITLAAVCFLLRGLNRRLIRSAGAAMFRRADGLWIIFLQRHVLEDPDGAPPVA